MQIFIALQCCQCSTMQVKQQKKSGNKWTCVVCNRRQSVRKVFSQGFMAKDVRGFVQSFNMSRQSAEGGDYSPWQTQPAMRPGVQVAAAAQFPIIRTKRRTDWTEYLDPDYAVRDEDEQEQEQEQEQTEIVTELSKDLFKKPKLKKPFTGLVSNEEEKRFRPMFPNRSALKPSLSKVVISGQDTTKEQWRTKDRKSSKWGEYITEDGGRDAVDGRRLRKGLSEAGEDASKSKWCDYITDDGSDLLLRGLEDFGSHTDADESSLGVLHGAADQTVDDEIHPDFK